jgi:sulfate transport system substrate-binding protein
MTLALRWRAGLLAAAVTLSPAALAADTLLNVSYDVTREFFKDYNAAFAAHWQKKTGRTLTLNQSHGGSSKQARHFADGGLFDQIYVPAGK